jgi:dolichol-phosphate mannosyltransferase
VPNPPIALELSVVVPVHNEEGAVGALATEVEQALAPLGHAWECIWVDDGSTDRTVAVLAEHLPGSRHRLLELQRNSGQSAALMAGFRAARGRFIATLDGDGQNNPADLMGMLARLRVGDVDAVNGIRAKRRDTWVRRVSSRIANAYRNGLTGEQVTDVGCAIRVFRRECTDFLPVFKGMHRYLPTLLRLHGFTITEMPVSHRPRETGRTKYGIHTRLWVGLADTLAICWMQRRVAVPRVKRELPE